MKEEAINVFRREKLGFYVEIVQEKNYNPKILYFIQDLRKKKRAKEQEIAIMEKKLEKLNTELENIEDQIDILKQKK